MKLLNGGQLESLKKSDDTKVWNLNFYAEGETVMMNLNDISLSYLSIQEAVKLRNELNEALKNAVGV